jgi:hypothetical protein
MASDILRTIPMAIPYGMEIPKKPSTKEVLMLCNGFPQIKHPPETCSVMAFERTFMMSLLL